MKGADAALHGRVMRVLTARGQENVSGSAQRMYGALDNDCRGQAIHIGIARDDGECAAACMKERTGRINRPAVSRPFDGLTSELVRRRNHVGPFSRAVPGRAATLRLLLNVLNRLGFVASVLSEDLSTSRTCRLRNASAERIRELIVENLSSLERVVSLLERTVFASTASAAI